MALAPYSGKEYNKMKTAYLNYVAAYRMLNNGSAEGATSFARFYMLMTYISKYNDPRVLASLGYK